MKMIYNRKDEEGIMLKLLRQKKVMKRVLWGLAIIIIPAFVLWGAGGSGEKGTYAGEIFGKNITFDEYRTSFNAVKNIAILAYGSDLNKVRDALHLEEAAWDRLVLIKEAQRKGINVSNEEVIARIAAYPIFQGKEGFFDQRNYAMILSNVLRTPPRGFEEEVRGSLILERLITLVLREVPEPLEAEIEEALKLDESSLLHEAEEGEEEPAEETPEKKRARARDTALTAKRLAVYKSWRNEVYARANLVTNIKPPEKETAESKEEVKEEIAEDTIDEGAEETPKAELFE